VAARSKGLAEQQANRAPGGVPDSSYAHVFWTAFRRSANAMFVVGLDRRIVAVNEAGTVLAARSADALTGERMTTLLDDPAEAPDDAVWGAQVLQGESLGDRRIRRPDGSTRIVDFAMRASRAAGTVLVLGVCVHDHGARRSERAHEPAPLTKREQEIVRLRALGEVTPEICAELHIAPDTVRSHVRNAMAKTGARTRAQLIACASPPRVGGLASRGRPLRCVRVPDSTDRAPRAALSTGERAAWYSREEPRAGRLASACRASLAAAVGAGPEEPAHEHAELALRAVGAASDVVDDDVAARPAGPARRCR
jgi:PAS domain S-box-containing protein